MTARPDGLFLVGSDVDIPFIKPRLEAATSLALTTPEEPEMALARGAALAAANARLGAPRTIPMPHPPDPLSGNHELAYSAQPDNRTEPPSGRQAADSSERRSRKSLFALVSVTMIFVGGVVALALALALTRCAAAWSTAASACTGWPDTRARPQSAAAGSAAGPQGGQSLGRLAASPLGPGSASIAAFRPTRQTGIARKIR
ncbi:MAG TPA: hypothetical protein VME67_03640 [Mycobacterium sp.]|nr:hypothetical protein [Mycobacterium sp.]HTX93996.1 hypothetical protein [Mycobacterium sp.]